MFSSSKTNSLWLYYSLSVSFLLLVFPGVTIDRVSHMLNKFVAHKGLQWNHPVAVTLLGGHVPSIGMKGHFVICPIYAHSTVKTFLHTN